MMLEKLIELDDIRLYPSEINQGKQTDKLNFAVTDDADKSSSLPIFTAPLDSIVNKENWSVFNKAGIRPILPRTESLQIRLEGCQYIFAAFSLREIIENFINYKRPCQQIFRICIDNGNGHDAEVFSVSGRLRSMYGNQVEIMTGPIGNPKTYLECCKAGIDFVRVGCNGFSLIDQKYGYYYPMASLLIDILGTKNLSAGLPKHTKIIADGGITDPLDILKCIALGADYVMSGRMLVRQVEAAGTIYKNERAATKEAMTREAVSGKSGKELREMNLVRPYGGNTTYDLGGNQYDDTHDWMGKRRFVDSKTEWVRVNSTLDELLRDMYDKFSYAFTMSNATGWESFKKNVRYCRL